MNFNIIGKRYIFLGFSGVLVLLSFLALAVFGLKQGIDLKGGVEWSVAYVVSGKTKPVSADAVRVALKNIIHTGEVSVKTSGDGTFIIRLPSASEAEHQTYLQLLQKLGTVQEKNFSSIGPSIGSELKDRALWAIAMVLIGISIYIAWAFRKVSAPVKSWKYGVVTLITLLHDVLIPAGMLAVLGKWAGVEIDTNFIVALLVVMGFSVHDTIVVFDRIRENLLLRRGGKASFGEIINYSVNETMVRSLNTSLTLIITLIALIVVGPASLFYFILTMLVGTIFGTYSSIFVASPLLYLWGRKVNR